MDTLTKKSAMMVTAFIDASVPSGRKVIKDLEKKRCVNIQYQSPAISGVWHKWEDVNDRAIEKMSNHYGVDMRPLVAQYAKNGSYEV